MKTEMHPVHTTFNTLPDTVRPFFEVSPGYNMHDKHTVEAELSRLPFISSANIERKRGSKESNIVDIPVSRIIGSMRPCDNWAARGEFKHTQGGDDVPSIDYALNISRSYEPRNSTKQPIIEAFEDSDGESWGLVVDGHHRVMAAKLLGVDLIEVDLRSSHVDETDRYDGSIIDEVARPT